jgi:hypothetical protein
MEWIHMATSTPKATSHNRLTDTPKVSVIPSLPLWNARQSS